MLDDVDVSNDTLSSSETARNWLATRSTPQATLRHHHDFVTTCFLDHSHKTLSAPLLRCGTPIMNTTWLPH